MAKKTTSETAFTESATAPLPAEVQRLVAQFAEHQERYQQGDYNETQLRRDFLDPFFGAMGWDMDQLVYELYGLTDKEIALVEEGTR